MKKISSNKKILVLGSTGFLGRSLFNRLQILGARVYGTVRKKDKSLKNRLVLDVQKNTAVKNFPWRSFDIIVDCTGYINYDKTLESTIQNIKSNVLAPLKIISYLNERQKYFSCSTHAVLLGEKEHNLYSFSKFIFERYIKITHDVLPKATIFRLPGLFHENRKTGLLHLIRESFIKKKSLILEISVKKWHIMYLPRAVDIIIAAILSKNTPEVVTVGYSTKIDIEEIISVAEVSFGYKIPVLFKKQQTESYVPDTKNQNLFYKITKNDFKQDLIRFFKSKS